MDLIIIKDESFKSLLPAFHDPNVGCCSLHMFVILSFRLSIAVHHNQNHAIVPGDSIKSDYVPPVDRVQTKNSTVLKERLRLCEHVTTDTGEI